MKDPMLEAWYQICTRGQSYSSYTDQPVKLQKLDRLDQVC